MMFIKNLKCGVIGFPINLKVASPLPHSEQDKQEEDIENIFDTSRRP
jgi:hypothetical protein